MAPNMMLLLVHHVSYQWLVLNVVYTWVDSLQKVFVHRCRYSWNEWQVGQINHIALEIMTMTKVYQMRLLTFIFV